MGRFLDKTVFHITFGIAIILLSCFLEFGCVEQETPVNREYTLVVISQRGVIDTFNVEAYNVWLHQGNLTRDFMEGKKDRRETIACGVYKFEEIK